MAAANGFHVPVERLDSKTIDTHYAIESVCEEFDAVDWYRQRAADATDPQLKAVLLHNAREEIEHAVMVLEWLRRTDPEFAKYMKRYLFTDPTPIMDVEHQAEHPNEKPSA